MLIITRRIGEKIMIGETISVMVLRVCGGQVRLGIEAPEGIKILREEIYQNNPFVLHEKLQDKKTIDAKEPVIIYTKKPRLNTCIPHTHFNAMQSTHKGS